MDRRIALPTDTLLDDSYRVGRLIGAGGFGMTYEAEDLRLRTRIAIKEYYPVEFGDRDATLSIRAKSEEFRKTFEWGRSSFLQEAQTLAKFKHPSIVRVTRVFEAFATAYMVMDFEEGQNLEAWLLGLGRAPTQEELDRLIAPMLDALELMHARNFLHRDIAPDNILVRHDGSPVLLDFGAARQAVAAMSRTVTGVVKAGYSPHEQYSSDARLQGAWSDIYALGATLYRAVVGVPPEEATLRVTDDRVPAAAQSARGPYRPQFLSAIDACLRINPSDRPRSVIELRPMLLAQSKAVLSAGARGAGQPLLVRAAAVAASVLLMGIGGYAVFEQLRPRPQIPRTDGHASLPANKSAHNNEARLREEMEAAKRKAEDEAARKKEAAESLDWGRASGSDRLDDYKFYLRTWPEGRFASLARNRMAQLQRLAALWEGMKGSRNLPKLRDFVEEAKPSEYATSAAMRLKELETAEVSEWKVAQDRGTHKGYEAFVALWPQGFYAETAHNTIAQLQTIKTEWERIRNSNDEQTLEEFVLKNGWCEYGAQATAQLVALRQQRRAPDNPKISVLTAERMLEVIDGATIRFPATDEVLQFATRMMPVYRPKLGTDFLKKLVKETVSAEGAFVASIPNQRLPTTIEGLGGIVRSKVDGTGSLFLLQMHGTERDRADVDRHDRQFRTMQIVQDAFGYVCIPTDWQSILADTKPIRMPERCTIAR